MLTGPHFLATYPNTSFFYEADDRQAIPEPLLTAEVKK